MSGSQHSHRSSSGIPLSILAEQFYQRMHVRNFAASTIKLRRDYLGRFLAWLDERGITRIEEVTRDVLLAYQRSLYHYSPYGKAP